MPHLLQIDTNALRSRCDILSRDIQVWRSACSYISQRMKLLISDEINDLTHPLCHRKLEDVSHFIGIVIRHRKALEALYDRCSNFCRMLMQHNYNVLLKKILEEELHLFDMMRNMGEAQIGLLQYDNELKLHEMSLY
ncbi:hypothetical protein CEXT_23741 [Caerostris extrusa]|uniref:Uncharacterized protein n=1 Tax=Caerostris extrusa TaxID=172846 RepID=A0AAV4Y375_CAEEX|nr:hypothetical protein CEXT_23741 [Caerostris extrusa]